MELKKLGALLIPLFIAAIFISTYLSNANYSVPTSVTTSIPQTAFGQGVANVVITGYGSPLSLSVACINKSKNNSTVSNVTLILTNMENNNSISNFYNSNMNFQVAAGNASSYGIYKYFQNSNSVQFGCLNFTGPAYIALPLAINFTVGSQKVQIPVTSNYRNNTITLPLSYGIGSHLRMKVSALITANGTLYGPLGLSMIQ